MTRMLSQLLGAKEPEFRYGLRDLENASGGSNSDIRLTTEIIQRTNEKIQELGLDPSDSTAQEIYSALQQRLNDDDKRLKEYLSLGSDASSEDILGATQKLVSDLNIPRKCFAIKMSVGKRLLKTLPPKKVMKELGYRSMESMIKHEPVPQLIAVALMYESPHWRQLFFEQYKLLKPSNFEQRDIVIYYPRGRKWETVAHEFAARFKDTTSLLSEFGSIIVMPITATIPNLTMTSTLLLLSQINEIRVKSSFMKLQQVMPDFGNVLYTLVSGVNNPVARIASQPLPWNAIHHYYSRLQASELPEVFDPHIQPEDLKLVSAEAVLAEKIPALEFWIGTGPLAMIDQDNTVSFNMLDVALNATNKLDLKDSVLRFVQEHVWNELLLKYLNPRNLEDVLDQLADGLIGPKRQLAPEAEMVGV